MRMFKPALTAIAFALFFGGVFVASFVLTAMLHRAFASIGVRAIGLG